MPHLASEVLAEAIESERRARDLYKRLSERISIEDGRLRMEQLSIEEEEHRRTLHRRYRELYKEDYRQDRAAPSGPAFALLEASTFAYTDLFEVLRLAVGAEEEAAAFYAQQLTATSEPQEVRMLKHLVRFEKGHRRALERELRRLTKRHG